MKPLSLVKPLSVVLVHRDQPERLLDTIDAFRAQDVPVTITVVDNGSATVPPVPPLSSPNVIYV